MPSSSTSSRWRRAAAAAGCALSVLSVLALPASAADLPRIALRVLVVSDGSPSVEAIAAQLDRVGVPYDRVVTDRPGRPTIDAAFLADAATSSGRYQSVVLPNAIGGGLAAAEMTALAQYETTFGVREVDAYEWANPSIGLQYATYTGALDGAHLTRTEAATAAGFGYLKGSLPVDDVSPAVTEVYGYLAQPAVPEAGSSFTPLLTATLGTNLGVLAGVHATAGRERLVVTAGYNSSMQWFSALAPGLVSWMTRGVHLGLQRNTFNVHVDDVFAPDSRWSVDANCTPGDACVDPTVTTPDIRMTSTDVDRLRAWQRRFGFRLDMVFNGGGSEDWKRTHGGSDPLADALLAAQAEFPWINHTWNHPFMGCIQIAPLVQGAPWTCATAPDAQPRQDATVPQAHDSGTYWAEQGFLTAQVLDNTAWARGKGLTDFDSTELVTGEHSGLRTLPNQPLDNPFLAPALAAAGVRVTASDASRESSSRILGTTATLPRHPMNVYYNTATYQEQVDEYNWYYTSRADGGSGICEDNPLTSTCIAPLPAATAAQAKTSFETYLAPLEVRNALRFVLSNDPRPFYAHQSNLAEDGLLYPVVQGVLEAYRSVFDTTTTPLLQSDMTTQRRTLQRTTDWAAAQDAPAYVDAAGVHVAPGTTEVPLTVPAGTRVTGATLESYGGELSGWVAGRVDAVPPLAAAGYRLAVPAQQVPGAPGTPTAMAGNAQATVTWSAPTSTGTAPLTSYVVRAYAAAAAAVLETTVPPTATTAVVGGLSNGTPYAFDVVAVSAAGAGAPSARSAAVVPVAPAAPTAPGAPLSVSARPSNASTAVSWAAPSSTGGSPVLGYVVRTLSASGVQLGSAQVPAGTTRHVMSGLVNGTSYAFEVAATNAVGTGPAARTPLVLPLPPNVSTPGVPRGVRAVGGAGTATVTWSAPANTGRAPLSGYLVTSTRYAADGTRVLSTSTVTVAASTLRLTRSLPTGTWRFSVAAVNLAGAGPRSAPTAAAAVT